LWLMGGGKREKGRPVVGKARLVKVGSGKGDCGVQERG